MPKEQCWNCIVMFLGLFVTVHGLKLVLAKMGPMC